jgi:hypothetical protein
MSVYTPEDAADARLGTLPLAGTDVEVVLYKINATDVCLIVNKAGICAYRCTLKNALADIIPWTDPHPLIDDTFVIRDIEAARRLLSEMTDEEISQRINERLR